MFRAGLRTTDARPVAAQPASDLAGVGSDGRPVELALGSAPVRWWLLAFVGPACDGCRAFFDGLVAPGRGGLPDGVGVAAVTRAPLPAGERVALAGGATGAGPLVAVASEEAWADYRVSGYPFYVVVDAARRVVAGETVGLGWDDVTATVHAAMAAAGPAGGVG